MPYLTPLPSGVTAQDEITTRRTATNKAWDKGGGVGVLRSHIGRVHHRNQFAPTPAWEEIDSTLTPSSPASQGWDMGVESADYFAHIARRSHQFSTFKNFEPEARGTDPADYDEIGIKVTKNVVGQLEAAHDGWVNQSVVYPNALGPVGSNNVAVDLRIICTNNGIKHLAVIADRPLGIATEMPLTFTLDIPTGYDIHIGTVDWTTRTGTERSSEVIRIGRTGTPVSEWLRLRRAKVWDQAGRMVPISVEFTDLGNGQVLMEKLIPRSFLQSALTAMDDGSSAFPCVTDAIISPFASAGDGSLEYFGGATWTVCRDAATATGALTNLEIFDGTAPRLGRIFVPFDCSALPAAFTATAADINLYCLAKTAGSTNKEFGIGAVTLTDHTSTPVDGDYDGMTKDSMTEYATRATYGDLTVDAYLSWDFDATGLAALVDGWNDFCIRDEYDLDNSAPSSNFRFRFADSEEAGTSTDPYFDLTYTAGGGGGGQPVDRRQRFMQLLQH